MKLKIQKGFFTWRLVNEKGETVAKISNQKIIGAAKKVSDNKGNIVFTTDIVNLPRQEKDMSYADSRKYIIYKNNNPVASANLFLESNTEDGATRAFAIRPPQVVKMAVETPYGKWLIQRQKNNGLTITHEGTTLANVSPFFKFKPICLEISEKHEITFWAGIYVLIEYMMHEDDIILV